MGDSLQELYSILDSDSGTSNRESDERSTAALIVSSMSNELDDDWSSSRDFLQGFHLVDSHVDELSFLEGPCMYEPATNNEPNCESISECSQMQTDVNNPIKLLITRKKRAASERARNWKSYIVEDEFSCEPDEENYEVANTKSCGVKVPGYLTAFRMKCKEYPFVYCCKHCGGIYTAIRAAQLHPCVRKRRGRKAIKHTEKNE